jgi:hypothetical protein
LKNKGECMGKKTPPPHRRDSAVPNVGTSLVPRSEDRLIYACESRLQLARVTDSLRQNARRYRGRAGTRESFGRRSPVAQSSKTGLLALRLRFSSVLMTALGGPVAFREVALRRSCRFASVCSNGYTTLTFPSTVSTYPARKDFCAKLASFLQAPPNVRECAGCPRKDARV